MKNKAAQSLGSISTPAKAAAARENGKLGGRPKRTVKLTLLDDGVRIDDGSDDGHYSYSELAKALTEAEPSTVAELWDALEELA